MPQAKCILASGIPAVPCGLDLERWYTPEPLVSLARRLADPGHIPSDRELLSLAASYFFACVFEGAESNPVPPAALAELYGLFARHGSLNEPDDDIELMNRLRRLSRPLGPLADPFPAAHALRALLALSRRVSGRAGYAGLDLGLGGGAGLGLMALGQHLLARRAGYAGPRVLAVEPDAAAAARAAALLGRLGAAEVACLDPTAPAAWDLLAGSPLAEPVLVTLGAVGWRWRHLTEAGFFAPMRRLCAALGGAAARAVWFPEALVAYSAELGVSLLLTREGGFQPSVRTAGGSFAVQGVRMEDRLLPLHKLGEGLGGTPGRGSD